MVGDLLISSSIPPKHPIVLPTVGELPKKLELKGENHIAGTAQKICIVNPHLAVAWAGRKIIAIDIIRRMKRYFSKRTIDSDTLKVFFKSQDAKNLEEIEMVCWYRNKQGLNSFGVNTTNIDTENFGHCHIGGTGAGDFIGHLYEERQLKIMEGNEDSPNAAVVHAISLASRIVANEMAGGENLASFYGGGIEIAAYIDGRYKKIGDTLNIFWTYNAEEDGSGMTFIPIIYKLDYLKENLVIRRVEFEVDEKTGDQKVKNYSTFIIESLLKPINKRKIDLRKLNDLNCKYLSSFIFVKNKDGQIYYKLSVKYSDDRKGPVRVSQTENGITLSYHTPFFLNELQAVIKGPGEFGDVVEVKD